MSGPATIDDVLVIVPGIMGSRLRHRTQGVIWGGVRTPGTLLDPRVLGLVGDGRRPDPDVAPDGLIGLPLQLPGLAKINAYNRLLDGLHERFVLDNTGLVVFDYDWRLACATNAKLLAEKVAPVLAARRRRVPQAQLVFIAHSMGGLVVAHYADALGGAPDIKHIVTIGTPFRGAVKAFGALTARPTGTLAPIRSRIQALVRTLPSVYELLPSYRVIAEQDTRRALTAADLPDDESSQSLYAAAAGFREALETAAHGGYKQHVLVGSHQPTAQFATIEAGEVQLRLHWNGLDERGDGTVPRQSVAPAGWDDDAAAVPFAQSHVALPGADGVIRVLNHVLTARPRAQQNSQRAKLALQAPDLVAVGDPLDVTVAVAEGDAELPLQVELEPLARPGEVRTRTPRDIEGALTARFDGLEPGDYNVRVRSGVRAPDVTPVWDLVTVVDPAIA